MNCKPGDLAVVIDCSGDCGKVVRVVEPGDDWSDWGDSRFHWACDTLGQRFSFENDVGLSDGAELVDIPDSNLRPIRDQDGEDETLTWADKPNEVTA